MNLQSMLLIGLLLGNNIANDIEYYENVYMEGHKLNQDKIYIQQVEENSNNITGLMELADYYKKLWVEDIYNIENFKKVETIYKKIIEINPSSTILVEFYLNAENDMGYYDVDENSNRMNLYKKAEKEYLRLLGIDSDNVELLTGLGDLYSDMYNYSIYYTDMDEVSYSKFFEGAEKMYLDALGVDENNIEVRRQLIDLYRDEWRIEDYYDDADDYKYFSKMEQQYLGILKIKPDLDSRVGLFYFYKESCIDEDIDCSDKAEEQCLEILKIEENDRSDVTRCTGNVFEDIWRDSNYTNSEAFEKAEYYYKYTLDIEPDNDEAQYGLEDIYIDAYNSGYDNSKEVFEKVERIYKGYELTEQTKYLTGVFYGLAGVYEKEWLNNKLDYTYYYMAENEYYRILDFEAKQDEDDIYSEIGLIDTYIYLSRLYITKYQFDGDIEALNKAKDLLSKNVVTEYLDSETQNYYYDAEKLNELGILYYNIWKTNMDDMQYCEKAESAFVKSLDIKNNYLVLFKLGELYAERWLLDKSDVQYKVKAIECFDHILRYGYMYSYDFDFEGHIYPILEKLEL